MPAYHDGSFTMPASNRGNTDLFRPEK